MSASFLDDTIGLLERTPRVLHELLGGIPDTWLEGRDTPDGWQPRDVVGHLISAELDDWIPRAERIMEHGADRAFDAFDRFAHVDRDRDIGIHGLLDRFVELRMANLEQLRELVTEDDLDRVGQHPSLGEVTMRQLLASWAVHDLDHIAQIFAAMSATQDDAVGPWRAYLGILLRREGPGTSPS
jgi:DinB family protein